MNERQLLEQKMQLLESVMAENSEHNKKHNEFLDKIDEALHNLTFQYYSTLFEKGAKHTVAYKDRLSMATISFASEIDRLMHDIFYKHWEQKWEQGKH